MTRTQSLPAPALSLIQSSLQVVAAGAFLGLMAEREGWSALILLLLLGVRFLLVHRRRTPHAGLAVAGACLTLLLGMGAEWWGTSQGYWSYHHLPLGRSLPLWLPMAWALAHLTVHRAEIHLQRLGMGKAGAFLVATVMLPFMGEASAVAAGVWTYHWPYQILGVPILALLLFPVLHGVIRSLLRRLAHWKRWADPIYGPGLGG